MPAAGVLTQLPVTVCKLVGIKAGHTFEYVILLSLRSCTCCTSQHIPVGHDTWPGLTGRLPMLAWCGPHPTSNRESQPHEKQTCLRTLLRLMQCGADIYSICDLINVDLRLAVQLSPVTTEVSKYLRAQYLVCQ